MCGTSEHGDVPRLRLDPRSWVFEQGALKSGSIGLCAVIGALDHGFDHFFGINDLAGANKTVVEMFSRQGVIDLLIFVVVVKFSEVHHLITVDCRKTREMPPVSCLNSWPITFIGLTCQSNKVEKKHNHVSCKAQSERLTEVVFTRSRDHKKNYIRKVSKPCTPNFNNSSTSASSSISSPWSVDIK